jgi:glycogen phosphorylase
MDGYRRTSGSLARELPASTGLPGNEIFSTTTPLPLAGAVGYTVRVPPRHPMPAASNELGLVTLV